MKSILISGASDIPLPVIAECRRLGRRARVAGFDTKAPRFVPLDLPAADSCGERAMNLFNNFRNNLGRTSQLAAVTGSILELNLT
jgi:hypothetical protein